MYLWVGFSAPSFSNKSTFSVGQQCLFPTITPKKTGSRPFIDVDSRNVPMSKFSLSFIFKQKEYVFPVGQQYFEIFPIAGKKSGSRHGVDVDRRNVPMSCFFLPRCRKKLGSRTVVDTAVDRRNVPMS